MRLKPGARLGPYEIIAPFEADADAERYRARDTRMEREVAIRILEQRVRAGGGVKHPNICVVYDAGIDEGTSYLVSELLEGETLSRRLKSGFMPPKAALETVCEVARGLSAAHKSGVVHGYLKPENIFLTRDGRVKILDFWLAKPDGADHRTDILACGAMLDEMLAGTRPAELQRIIQRCREKDPDRRFQSASDLAFALEGVSFENAGSERPSSRRAFLIAGTGIASSAATFYLGRRLAQGTGPVFRRLTFRRGTVFSARFVPGGNTIVYDAQWEGGEPRIYTTRGETTESIALGIPPARLAAVSASGELAIILQRGNTLARVPVAGGTPRDVLHNIIGADWSPDGQTLLIVRQVTTKHRIEFPAGQVLYQTDSLIQQARLSRDGKRVAFFEKSGSPETVSLNVVDRNGAKRTLVSKLTNGLSLAWAPHGNEVWFSASAGSDVPAVRAVDGNGTVRPLLGMTETAAISDARSGGQALFTGITRRAGMMCQPPGVPSERDLSWLNHSAATDISPDGSVVLFTEEGDTRRAYRRKTDGSPAVALASGLSCGLSPDAQWAAIIDPGSPRELRILPTGGGEPKVLKPDRFTYIDARWFADGKRLLVYGRIDERVERHFVQDATGGPLRPVTSEGSAIEAAIDPDGEYVAAHAGPGVFLYPLNGAEPERVRGDTADARPVVWSSDGKSLYVRRGNTIEQVNLKTGKSEVWKDLTPADPAGVLDMGRVYMTPDAQAYVYSYEREQSDLYLADGM